MFYILIHRSKFIQVSNLQQKKHLLCHQRLTKPCKGQYCTLGNVGTVKRQKTQQACHRKKNHAAFFFYTVLRSIKHATDWSVLIVSKKQNTRDLVAEVDRYERLQDRRLGPFTFHNKMSTFCGSGFIKTESICHSTWSLNSLIVAKSFCSAWKRSEWTTRYMSHINALTENKLQITRYSGTSEVLLQF